MSKPKRPDKPSDPLESDIIKSMDDISERLPQAYLLAPLEALFNRNGLGQKEARQAYAEFLEEAKPYLRWITIKQGPRQGAEVSSQPIDKNIADTIDAIFTKTLQRWEGRLRINEQAYRELGYWFVEGPPASFFYSLEYAILKRKEAEDRAKQAENRAKKAEARATKAERTTKALQTKSNRFRLSGHLAEQIIKAGQLGLFEEPLVDVRDITEGSEKQTYLDLNAQENLLVLALGKLLHLYSQTDNPNKPDYYLGNRQDIPTELQNPEKTTLQVIRENTAESLPVPQVLLSTHEIAREYMGKQPSGADLVTVENLLEELSRRQQRIVYQRTLAGKTKKGKNVIDINTFELSMPLIFLGKLAQERTEEGGQVRERSLKVITLNPVFIDQIQTKYQDFPEDYIKRIREAWPGRSIPNPLIMLAYYINSIRASKTNKLDPHPIYVSTLMEKIDPATYRKSKKRALQKAEEYLETCKIVGLIQGWQKQSGATGELLYQLRINRKWD
jgi:hypothetical protein